MKEQFIIRDMGTGLFANKIEPYDQILWYTFTKAKNQMQFDTEALAIAAAKKIKEVKVFSIIKIYVK